MEGVGDGGWELKFVVVGSSKLSEVKRIEGEERRGGGVSLT